MKYVKRTDCSTIEELFLRNQGVACLNDVTEWFRRYNRDEYRLDGIDKVADIIHKLDSDKPIIISGDYDVDGITSTAIIYLTLSWLGFKNVKIFIPNRFTDGFGINDKVFDMSKDGLIMTVDNGIAQTELIKKAKDLGYTVIVTDHHEPGLDDNGYPVIPNADVVIDPCAIPGQADFSGYCGAGIAFKIARRLLNNDPEKRQILLSLACLGTVCDVMELTEENYVFVRHGLKCLKQRNTTTSGVYALVQAFNLADTVTAHDCGFNLGPAINAVSRMLGDATEAMDLLKFDGPFEHSRKDAAKLLSINNTRKQATQEAYRYLKDLIEEKDYAKKAPIIVYLQGISEGLPGILAGRICEEYRVPSIVLTDSTIPGILKGSARSLDGYHMKDHLDKVSYLLEEYGGHAGAAGLSLREENLSVLRDSLVGLNDFIKISDKDIIEYDLETDLKDIKDCLMEMDRFEPFGEGNPAPVFKVKGFMPKQDKFGRRIQLCGSDLTTVRLQSTHGTAIGFNMSSMVKEINESIPMTLYGTLSWNYFNGKKEPQIEFVGIENEDMAA